jgi:rod shape-determining protein MreC
LIVLLVAQLILLSLHGSDPGGERSAVEKLALRVAGPFPRLVAAITGSFGSLSEYLALRRHLIAENESLHAEVEALRRERVRLYGLEHNFERLGEAVMYSLPPRGDLRVADVIYIDHASWLQTMLLWVGHSPIRVNQPVVAAAGVVGRVILVAGPYAKVQLVTDHAASVGAMITRTRRQGVVRGADNGMLELDFVPLQADVRVGDKVVTAGIDGIYGRGIPIGTVTAVSPGKELFHEIEVMPEVDFGRLDQVYLLARDPVPESLKEARGDAQP